MFRRTITLRNHTDTADDVYPQVSAALRDALEAILPDCTAASGTWPNCAWNHGRETLKTSEWTAEANAQTRPPTVEVQVRSSDGCGPLICWWALPPQARRLYRRCRWILPLPSSPGTDAKLLSGCELFACYDVDGMRTGAACMVQKTVLRICEHFCCGPVTNAGSRSCWSRRFPTTPSRSITASSGTAVRCRPCHGAESPELLEKCRHLGRSRLSRRRRAPLPPRLCGARSGCSASMLSSADGANGRARQAGTARQDRHFSWLLLPTTRFLPSSPAGGTKSKRSGRYSSVCVSRQAQAAQDQEQSGLSDEFFADFERTLAELDARNRDLAASQNEVRRLNYVIQQLRNPAETLAAAQGCDEPYVTLSDRAAHARQEFGAPAKRELITAGGTLLRKLASEALRKNQIRGLPAGRAGHLLCLSAQPDERGSTCRLSICVGRKCASGEIYASHDTYQRERKKGWSEADYQEARNWFDEWEGSGQLEMALQP